MPIILEIDAAEGSLILDLIRGALEKSDLWSQPRYVEALRHLDAKVTDAMGKPSIPKTIRDGECDYDVFLP